MNELMRNKKAFFSMEAIICFLVLWVLFSWIVVLASKAANVHQSLQNEALADVHAEYIFKQIKNAPREKLAVEIQRGNWNFPNAPAVLALGLGALPNETIKTESEGAHIQVTVRWQNRDGQYKDKQFRMALETSPEAANL